MNELTIQHKLIIGLITAVILGLFTLAFASDETEREKVERIAGLDYMRKEQLEQAKTDIKKLQSCITDIDKEMGKDIGIKQCNFREVKVSEGTTSVPSKEVNTNTGVTNTWTVVMKHSVSDITLMDKICKYGRMEGKWVSPLCNNWDLFYILKKITDERIPNGWQWFNIMVWVSYAESHIWVNYARDSVWGTCYGRNNWGWAKYMINDDNTRIYRSLVNSYGSATINGRVAFVDMYGCNLFPFKTIADYWISKSNWFRFWYASCINSKQPIKCLSYKYVGNPNVSEDSWVNRVSLFLN